MEINNSGSSNYSFDRYVILKSTLTTTVLTALSYGAHYALKQRNLPHLTNALQQHCALATLATITFVGSAVLFGRRPADEVSGNDGKKDKKQEKEISFQQIPEGKYQEVYEKLNGADANFVSLQIETNTELLTLTIQNKPEALVFLKEKLGLKDGQHSPAGKFGNNASAKPKPKPKAKSQGNQKKQEENNNPPVGTTSSNGNPRKVPSKSTTGTSSTYSHSSSSTYPRSRPAKMPEGVGKARREEQPKLKEKESPKNDEFCGFEDTWKDCSRPDRGMKVEPAEYQEKVHGLNGEKMRERLFKTLLEEYCRIVKEQIGIDLEQKKNALAKSSYKGSQGEMIQNALFYLTTDGSEKDPSKPYGEGLYGAAGYAWESMKDSCAWLTGSRVAGPFEKRYIYFTQAHRNLIDDYTGKENSYFQDGVAIGRALSYARMVPEIQSLQESLVHAHLKSVPQMTAANFHQAFSLRNEAIRNADYRMKLSSHESAAVKVKGSTSISDYFATNPSNLRRVETWKRGSETKEIYHLRHSTPHLGTYMEQAPIDPIYRDFLRGAAAPEKNQGVLYAAHQRLGDYIPTSSSPEAEGYRADSIIALEKDHPNLLVLFQSVESDLFMKPQTDIEKVKNALITSFKQVDGNKRNRLPKCLMEKEGVIKANYENELRGILNFVHQTFFPGAKGFSGEKLDYYGNLTKEKELTCESQAFIMLFYHFQREHLKHADLSQYGFKYSVTFVNTGCKDDFDRGLGQNMTTDRVHQTIRYGAGVPHEDLEATASSGQAPPIPAKGVAVIHYRVQPALFVSSLLAHLSGEQLTALQQKDWNGWQLESYDVRRHAEQSAVPVPA